MDEQHEYLWDGRDVQEEFERLNWQAGFLDEFTRMRLSSLNLGPGIRCLEVGPGAGSMTRWMADQGWSVQALDISDRYFPGIAREGIELRVGDVRSIRINEEFDLVFLRYVFHHLPERWDVLKKLVGSVKPGGWLLAEEPSVKLMTTLAGEPDAMAFFRNILTVHMGKLGVDFDCGAQLATMFGEVGLTKIQAVGNFTMAFDGAEARDYIRLALDMTQQHLVPLGEDPADFDKWRAQVYAPDFVGMMPVNISCRGQRPA
jgi:SAM-dependent methyltransferase